MDLKKLLNETESIKQAMADRHRADHLDRFLGSGPDDLERSMSAARLGIPESAVITPEKVARQAAENALGLISIPATDFPTMEEKLRKDVARAAGLGTLASGDTLSLSDRFRADAEKLSGVFGREHAPELQGGTTINLEDLEKQHDERKHGLILNSAFDPMEHMTREAVEHRRREEAKVEYARRSAKASEAALEAEKARTADAKADARRAREEARISRRNMRISLWFAAGSLLLAAWPFIKESFGL